MLQEAWLALCFSKLPLFWSGYSLSLASTINFFLGLLVTAYSDLVFIVFTVSWHLLLYAFTFLVSAFFFVNCFCLTPSFLTTPLSISLCLSLSLSLGFKLPKMKDLISAIVILRFSLFGRVSHLLHFK